MIVLDQTEPPLWSTPSKVQEKLQIKEIYSRQNYHRSKLKWANFAICARILQAMVLCIALRDSETQIYWSERHHEPFHIIFTKGSCIQGSIIIYFFLSPSRKVQTQKVAVYISAVKLFIRKKMSEDGRLLWNHEFCKF